MSTFVDPQTDSSTEQRANWQNTEDAFRALFERQWYTNHGPLAQQFEQRLAAHCSAAHAVCATNAAIALTMAFEALKPKGHVMVIGPSNPLVVDALRWAGWVVQSSPHPLANTGLVVCSSTRSADLAQAQVLAFTLRCPWVLDCTADENPSSLHIATQWMLASQGKGVHNPRVAVFSMHRGHAIEAQGAGCILTHEDALAESLRNIRSSYGTRSTVAVCKTANGRMSEAQAAFGLLSLAQQEANPQ